MSENGNQPAYPSHGTMGEVVTEGMTKREAFAMAAMQGYCANPAFFQTEVLEASGSALGLKGETTSTQILVMVSAATADALLAELEKQP